MRTINRNSNYELVYSTRNILNKGSRDGNAGNRPSRRDSGSRRGGMGQTSESGTRGGNPSRRLGYFAEDKPGNYTPSDVIKEKQQIRKRGEDFGGEGHQEDNERRIKK